MFPGRPTLTALILGMVLITSGLQADDRATENAKARLEAARKVYEALLKRYKVGTDLDPESLYRWSRRWLTAERDLGKKKDDLTTALTAHLERMKALETIVKRRRDQGAASAADVAAVEFYRLEAEQELAQARSR